jgi:hypothetical protein
MDRKSILCALALMATAAGAQPAAQESYVATVSGPLGSL